MTFSICIASYGADRWKVLARERAYPSAVAQEELDEVVIYHDPDGSVATSRNECALKASGDYLIFLDADDELAPSYIAAMKDALSVQEHPEKILFTPAVSYVTGGRKRFVASPPKFWPEVPLRTANWLVIGTAISRDFFFSIGGFADEPAFGAFEDYELWIRAEKAGAMIVRVPDAIYRAWKDAASRHRGASLRERVLWHYEIGRIHFPEIYTESWLQRRVRGRR